MSVQGECVGGVCRGSVQGECAGIHILMSCVDCI